MREYHKHFLITAPEDDYDDRMTLYEMFVASLKFSFTCTSGLAYKWQTLTPDCLYAVPGYCQLS